MAGSVTTGAVGPIAAMNCIECDESRVPGASPWFKYTTLPVERQRIRGAIAASMGTLDFSIRYAIACGHCT
jgi:hypothetical protein